MSEPQPQESSPHRIIRLAILAMALLVVVLAGYGAWDAYGDYHRAKRVERVDRIAAHSLRVTLAVARERGWTAAALGAAPDPGDLTSRMREARAQSDRRWRAYRRVAGSLDGADPDLERARQRAREARADLREARARVDRLLETASGPAPLDSWFAAATGLNQALLAVGQAAERSADLSTRVGALFAIRDRVWTMSEYAGRERGRLAYFLSADRPLSGDARSRLQRYRGVIQASTARLEPPPGSGLEPALTDMRQRYFRGFEDVRRRIYAAGADGRYPLDGGAWMERATAAIDAVIEVSEAATAAIRDRASALAGAARRGLLATTVFLFAALGLTVLGVRRVHAAADELVRQREEAETGLRQAEEEVYELAYFDPLTGLANRFLFTRHLGEATARLRNGERGAVILIDLYRFGRINESLGPRFGDQLLQEVAGVLRARLGPEDEGGRFGGVQFALLLNRIRSRDELLDRVRHLQETFAQPFLISGYELSLGVSLGISLLGRDTADPTAAIGQAETALVRAKAGGPGDYAFFTQEMNEEAVRHLGLESALQKAREREELRLFYQPQVDLRSGEIVGMEALLRWERPGQGLVSPGEFVPLLEDTGLIVEVGEWVLRTACRQAAEWYRQGHPLKVAVNVSLRQFQDPRLVERVGAILRESDMPKDWLCCDLEITESLFMEDVPSTEATLEELRGLGVGLALDDFGTGYSSLTHLHRFPVQTLKIDRSFVMGMEEVPRYRDMIRAIVTMANALGLESVAEGVETPAAAAALAEMGCRTAQGFGFSPPVPAEEIDRILSQGARLTVAEAGSA